MAFKQNIAVSGGVNQSVVSIPGIEFGDGEVVQLPLALLGEAASYLVPKPTVFAAAGTFRLTVTQAAAHSVIWSDDTGQGCSRSPPTTLKMGMSRSQTSLPCRFLAH